MTWEKYDDKRIFKIAEEKVLVVKPSTKQDPTPLFCPVCKFTLTSADDFLSHRDLSCCNKCKIYLASKDIEGWKQGKRPSSETMEEYMKYRFQTFKPSFRFS